MNALRAILNWISRHRLVTMAMVVILGGAGIYARMVMIRSDGVLSDPIERKPIVQAVYGIGTVVANQSFQLKPGVTNTINDLFVREGDTLSKGAQLARIDHVLYRAPFDGTVTYLPFKVGENIFASTTVLTLVNLLDRYVLVTLEQQGALRVKAGQRATLSFDSIREENYKGVVHSVYSNDNNFLARIDCSNLPARILPGMNADVAIEITEHENALLVPIAAYDRGAIWIKRGNAVVRRVSVQTGIVDKDKAEIASGDIQIGDRVLMRRNLNQ